MAKVKYDVSGYQDIENNHAPVGTYVLTVENVDGPKPSSQGNTMLEVRFKPTHDAGGKKLKEDYAPLWHYPLLDHDHPFAQARMKEFIAAFGLKSSGTLDTDKLKGKKVLARLKADTDQDGDYRPRIGKLMKFDPDAAGEEPDEQEEEAEESEEEEDAIDLDTLNRTELKKLIKEEGLEIKVVKSMSDDDIREAIAEAMGADEDEEEEEEAEEEEAEEEEQDEPEDQSNGYDEMSVAELKAELKERELPTNGARKVLVARLQKDDQGEPF